MRPTSSEAALHRRTVALVALAGLVGGCFGLTVSDEQRLGAELAAQARREMLFLRDAVVVDYVRDIGGRIVAAAGPQEFVFHFEVVEDDQINAFAAPGGYVYVQTGTILAARNVSELAAVIAHEIGHVTLRHISDNYARQRGANTLTQAGVLAASVFGYGGLASLGGGLAAMAALNQFTQADELEADEFAVEVLPRAGFDPSGLLSFLEMLARAEQGGRPPAFMTSHPATSARVAEAQTLIDEQPALRDLETTDRGRLEIIQRRIELLTRKVRPTGRQPL